MLSFAAVALLLTATDLTINNEELVYKGIQGGEVLMLFGHAEMFLGRKLVKAGMRSSIVEILYIKQ